VKWDDGVVVEDDETSVIFDPQKPNPKYKDVLITHSHLDHAKGFIFNDCKTYSTSETFDLTSVYGNAKKEDWKPLSYRSTVRFESLEVKSYNAGHILGSSIFEVVAAEGSLVYTGDLNTTDTLTMKAADIVPCDVLVIESTFGEPRFNFPSREDLSVEIMNWTVKTLREGKVPVIRSDSTGNSQELICLFNQLTTIPVVTHPRVTRISEVYRKYGFNLSYRDATSEEGTELLDNHECVLLAPKTGKLPEKIDYECAYASGWAIYPPRGMTGFPLSDHADFPHLFNFVKETKPKLVLTCFGSRNNDVFASYVEKKLGVKARPLSSREEEIGSQSSGEWRRSETCFREVMKVVRVPGFEYKSEWIVGQVGRKGFSRGEVEKVLSLLTRKGVLRFSEESGTYELRKGST